MQKIYISLICLHLYNMDVTNHNIVLYVGYATILALVACETGKDRDTLSLLCPNLVHVLNKSLVEYHCSYEYL